jgi:hypothetical protein
MVALRKRGDILSEKWRSYHEGPFREFVNVIQHIGSFNATSVTLLLGVKRVSAE